MQFVYYLPGMQGADPKHLEQAGLGGLLRKGDSDPHVQDLRGIGPDGKGRGQVWAWPNRKPGPSFLPEKQKWEPSHDGKYWIGRQNAALPGPADLIRDDRVLVDGFAMPLGDGNRWVLPNAFQLPHCWGLGEDGGPKKVPTPEWEEVARRAVWACETICARMQSRIDDDPQSQELDAQTERELLAYVASMLSLNYRVDLATCLRLKLFNDSNLLAAAMVTTEAEKILNLQDELKKKTAPETSTG